jgi:integrase
MPPFDEDRVRDWLAAMAERVADRELSAKTVNNARTCLSMTLGEAVRRRHIPQNPCRWVPELPAQRVEIDYLRLREIDRYLDACIAAYRPLAEFLIGTGARISEALAVRWPDVDLDDGTTQARPAAGVAAVLRDGQPRRAQLLSPDHADHRLVIHQGQPLLDRGSRDPASPIDHAPPGTGVATRRQLPLATHSGSCARRGGRGGGGGGEHPLYAALDVSTGQVIGQ